MCMNRPIPGSPFHTATAAATTAIDFPPGVPREEVWVDDELAARLPLPLRVCGFALSRAEWAHRRAKRIARASRIAFRQLVRTRTGFFLVALNAALWGLYAATLILGIK